MRHAATAAVFLLLPIAMAPTTLRAEDAIGVAAYGVEQAAADARARSGALRVKTLDAARAGYAVKEAQSRAMPQLSLTASSTFMTNPPEGIRIAQGAFGAAPQPGSEYPIFLPTEDYVLLDDTKPTYFRITGTLEQVLWTWGKVRKAIEIAELDRRIAEGSVRSAASRLVHDVGSAYFGAVAARESARLLGRAEELARQMVADREASFAAGTVTRQDVLETRSQLAQIASQRVRADQGLRTALDGLEYLTGRRAGADALTSPFRDALPEVDEAALVKSALASSAELEALALKGRQAKAAEEIRRASLLGLPDFSLNVALSVEGQEVPLLAGNWTDTWDANLMLTVAGKVTLFDSLASIWRLRQAELQREQALIGADELARGTATQVRRLVDAAVTSSAKTAEKRAALEFAAERARNATISWENELTSRAEERGARMLALTAELDLLLALLETESAIAELELATGISFPRD